MSNEIVLPSDAVVAERATHVSQTTAVEQARAVAEVQAAVVVAQQVPRNLSLSVGAMRESCKQRGLADRAFFRFPRAGQTVSGPSVHLARELARCWGNVQYGIQELRRDDAAGYSEMQAWAWDVQTNTRSMQTFVGPHKRDTKKGAVDLTDLRDIYENNANQGSRRLREAIFAILPTWFTEEAKEICTQTLQDGGEKTVAQQVADATRVFDQLGVSLASLEARFGPSGSWQPHDLAQLRVIHASIKQGTVRVEDEFPSLIDVDEIPEKIPAKVNGSRKTSPATKKNEENTEQEPQPQDDPWGLLEPKGA